MRKGFREKVVIELVTSDRKLKASREGSGQGAVGDAVVHPPNQVLVHAPLYAFGLFVGVEGTGPSGTQGVRVAFHDPPIVKAYIYLYFYIYIYIYIYVCVCSYIYI